MPFNLPNPFVVNKKTMIPKEPLFIDNQSNYNSTPDIVKKKETNVYKYDTGQTSSKPRASLVPWIGIIPQSVVEASPQVFKKESNNLGTKGKLEWLLTIAGNVIGSPVWLASKLPWAGIVEKGISVGKNLLSKLSKVKSDDIAVMEKFIDYARLKKPLDTNLEIQARLFAEWFWINPDVSNWVLANKLEPILKWAADIERPVLKKENTINMIGYHIPRDLKSLKNIEEKGFNLKTFGKESGASEMGDPKGVYFFPDTSYKKLEWWDELAKNVGVIKKELNIKNPFTFNSIIDVDKYLKEIINPSHPVKFKNFNEYINYREDLNTKFDSSLAITERLKELGYDSIIDKNWIYSKASIGVKEPQIIILNPEQVNKLGLIK